MNCPVCSGEGLMTDALRANSRRRWKCKRNPEHRWTAEIEVIDRRFERITVERVVSIRGDSDAQARNRELRKHRATQQVKLAGRAA